MATRWALGGTVGHAEAPRLVAELTDLLRPGRTADETGGRDVHCDVSGITDPDVATIDVLARLQVSALRMGHRLVLVGARADLLALIALLGLRAALPTA